MFTPIIKDANEATGRYRFEIKEPSLGLAFVNGLRRIILTNIAVVGFMSEDSPSFKIHVNNGPLHNEFMQHRLGLLPVFMSLDETKAYAKEAGGTDDLLEFEVNVKNTTNEMIRVKTKDFTCKYKGEIVPIEKYFRNGEIVITHLRAKEQLHATGIPTIGTAGMHAGFAPVSLCTLSFKQDTEKGAGKSIIESERAFIADEYGDPKEFIFELEPETGMTAHDIVSEAIRIMHSKITGMIDMLESGEIAPKPVNNMTEFTFLNEDDTVGHLVQSYAHIKYIRHGGSDNKYKLTYIGYFCPHPLEKSVVIRINTGEDTEGRGLNVMLSILNEVAGEIESASHAWSANKV